MGAPGGGSGAQVRTSRPQFCPHPISQSSVTCQCLTFLPGEFHGQKSLAGYNLWDRKESDLTE